MQTARLAFRDLTVDDFDAVYAYASDPEVTRYTAFGPNTVEQTREFLQRSHAQRLWAHVFVGNTASERVLQKLGFRDEGCALKSFFVRNTWFDLQTFAMLAASGSSASAEAPHSP